MNTTRETPFTEAIASLYRLIGDMRPASLRTQAFEYVARVAAELERLERLHALETERAGKAENESFVALQDAARLRDGLRRIEWHFEVDVNGEYTTTRPKYASEIRSEIDALLSASQATEEMA